MTSFDGLVLAGGRGRRLGGVDKTTLDVGGQPTLDLVLAALADADRRVVVGPGGEVIEDPPGGGPVAAIAAGLRAVTAPVVVILGTDLPFVTRTAVRLLAEQAPAVAVDDAGRDQFLLGAYPSEQLRRALPVPPDGARLGDVVHQLEPRRLALPGTPPPWWDCDTPQQLAQARAWT